MLYYYLLFFYVLFSQITNKRDTRKLLVISFATLIILAALRFGLGTDYFTYYSYYDSVIGNSIKSLQPKYFLLSQVEPLYYFSEFLFKSLNLSYEYFVAFCSTFSLILIYNAINKISKIKMFSLFIFFSNYFLIEICNMIRQGLAMSIFIYGLASFLVDRKKRKYILCVLLASCFHFSALISLFVLIIDKLPKRWFYNYISILVLSVMSIGFGFIFPKIVIFLISKLFSRYSAYKLDSFNILALGLRCLELFLIVSLSREAGKDKITESLYRIFILGIYLSFLCINMTVLTRLTEYFLFIEVLLVPNLMFTASQNKRSIYISIFILLYIFLFSKDIHSFSGQGRFVSKTKIYEYPYVSIFNKEEIKEIRPFDSYKRYFYDNKKN